MNTEKKESYVQPALVKHELLRDITATKSGYTGTPDRQERHHRR